ncbi:hypothetical protein GOHSU_67_00050 [Gordonia hirsuta DSM 44140 = NBRC 16056]|uniref:Secreted protein n=1 Tax=Gordonia hirsuta DSM 44140 = NBRC 16056 TaxID=1121927 RepID=L7LG30_9ACTN|nr:hypothetical protein [Gordonia hirsuta]GAC59003.1 hypothetical protein GOHSU_67_00050 [Gordonia hirsuta DSM 44140 = NBRC 16056]
MKKTLKRAAVAVAAAGTVGAGALLAPAPAQAAGPGDLQIIGGVNCEFKAWGPNWNSGPVWQMKRFLGVTNVGGSTMTGVTVTEFGGATKMVPANKDKKTKAGELKPGQTAITVTNTWKGCWPASISGYTIGDQVENPFNNVGYWQNVRRVQPNP